MRPPCVIGPLVVTTTRQMAEAPILDSVRTWNEEWDAFGWALKVRPTEGTALVVASRRRFMGPHPPRALRNWGPFAMRHGGWAHWHPRRIQRRRPTPRVVEGAYAAEAPDA
jgi:hypothetical protein